MPSIRGAAAPGPASSLMALFMVKYHASPCYHCGKTTWKIGASEYLFRFQDTWAAIGIDAVRCHLPGIICIECGETEVDGIELHLAELMCVRMLLRANAHTRSVFKFARKALGYQAGVLGHKLRLAPGVILEYENGELSQKEMLQTPKWFSLLQLWVEEELRRVCLDLTKFQRV